MYILKKKSKDTEFYYLCKSYRSPKTKKNSTKIIEKLGTAEEIKSKYNCENLDKWLKDYAKEKTDEDKKYIKNTSVNLNNNKRINKNEQRIYNGGYFALQKICYSLGIDKICNDIKKENKLNFDLAKIFMSLIYDRIIYAPEENSYRSYIACMIENFNYSKNVFNESLKILSENSTRIQFELFQNANALLNYEPSLIFNECMHYCYDINQYKQTNKKEISAKSSFDVVQLDLFYDKNGIPLAYFNHSDDNSTNRSKEIIIGAINYWNGESQIVSFSDNIPSKIVKSINNDYENCAFIKNLNIKILKKHLREWIMNKDGWNAYGTDDIYNLSEVENLLYDTNVTAKKRGKLEIIIFYKVCKITTSGIDQTNSNDEDNYKKLIVGFSFLGKREDRLYRNDRYENMKAILDQQIIDKYENDPEAFIEFFAKFKKFLSSNLKESTKEDTFVYDFDSDIINEENQYDGFFACLSDSKINDDSNIVYNRINSWLIDYIFKPTKRGFRVIPDSVNKQDAINAHLIVSYTSLMVAKIFQKLIKGRFSLEYIRNVMASHNYIKIPGQGWCPAFMPTDISDALDEICDIKSDYEFISDDQMKEILKKTKEKINIKNF